MLADGQRLRNPNDLAKSVCRERLPPTHPGTPCPRAGPYRYSSTDPGLCAYTGGASVPFLRPVHRAILLLRPGTVQARRAPSARSFPATAGRGAHSHSSRPSLEPRPSRSEHADTSDDVSWSRMWRPLRSLCRLRSHRLRLPPLTTGSTSGGRIGPSRRGRGADIVWTLRAVRAALRSGARSTR